MTEYELLARWLEYLGDDYDDVYRPPSALARPHLRRAAALLRKARPQMVPVADRPWERPGWCNARGRCWIRGTVEGDWRLLDPLNAGLPKLRYAFDFALPHWAIPTPPPNPLPRRPPMNAPIPCNCWLMDIERRHDEPPCPSPCVFDDPSERVDDCSDAMMLLDTGKSKTDCVHYRATASAAELTHDELLDIAKGVEPWATWLAPCGCLESVHFELAELMSAAIAADRAARPQPTAEALQRAYVEWFRANQAIAPSAMAARTAALFTLAVLVGEVEL